MFQQECTDLRAKLVRETTPHWTADFVISGSTATTSKERNRFCHHFAGLDSERLQVFLDFFVFLGFDAFWWPKDNGPAPALDSRSAIALAMVRLRRKTTCETLSVLFGVSRSTVEATIHRCVWFMDRTHDLMLTQTHVSAGSFVLSEHVS